MDLKHEFQIQHQKNKIDVEFEDEPRCKEMSKKIEYRELRPDEFVIKEGKYGTLNPGIIECEGFDFHFRLIRYIKANQCHTRIFYCSRSKQSGCKKNIRELMDSSSSSQNPRKFFISNHGHYHGASSNAPPIMNTESESFNKISIVEFQRPHHYYNFPCSNITFSISQELLPFFHSKSSNNFFVFLRDRAGTCTTVRILEENLIQRRRQLVLRCHLEDFQSLRGPVDCFSSFFLFRNHEHYIYNPKRSSVFFQNVSSENNTSTKKNLTTPEMMERNDDAEFGVGRNHHQSTSTIPGVSASSRLKKRRRDDNLVINASAIYGVHPCQGPLEGNQTVDVFFNIGMDSFFRRLLDCKNIINLCFFGNKRAEVAEKAVLYEETRFRKKGDETFESRKSDLEVAQFTIAVRTPMYENPGWVDVTLRSVGDLFSVTKEDGYRYYQGNSNEPLFGIPVTYGQQENKQKSLFGDAEDDIFGNDNYDEGISNSSPLVGFGEDDFSDLIHYSLVYATESLMKSIKKNEEKKHQFFKAYEKEWEKKEWGKVMDIFGGNLLFYAVAQNQLELVKFLVKAEREDQNLYFQHAILKKDIFGFDVLDVALHFKHNRMFLFLKKELTSRVPDFKRKCP